MLEEKKELDEEGAWRFYVCLVCNERHYTDNDYPVVSESTTHKFACVIYNKKSFDEAIKRLIKYLPYNPYLDFESMEVM